MANCFLNLNLGLAVCFLANNVECFATQKTLRKRAESAYSSVSSSFSALASEWEEDDSDDEPTQEQKSQPSLTDDPAEISSSPIGGQTDDDDDWSSADSLRGKVKPRTKYSVKDLRDLASESEWFANRQYVGTIAFQNLEISRIKMRDLEQEVGIKHLEDIRILKQILLRLKTTGAKKDLKAMRSFEFEAFCNANLLKYSSEYKVERNFLVSAVSMNYCQYTSAPKVSIEQYNQIMAVTELDAKFQSLWIDYKTGSFDYLYLKNGNPDPYQINHFIEILERRIWVAKAHGAVVVFLAQNKFPDFILAILTQKNVPIIRI